MFFIATIPLTIETKSLEIEYINTNNYKNEQVKAFKENLVWCSFLLLANSYAIDTKRKQWHGHQQTSLLKENSFADERKKRNIQVFLIFGKKVKKTTTYCPRWHWRCNKQGFQRHLKPHIELLLFCTHPLRSLADDLTIRLLRPRYQRILAESSIRRFATSL